MAKTKKTKSEAGPTDGALDSNVDPTKVGEMVKGDMKGEVAKASVTPQRVLENGVSITEVDNPSPGNPGVASPSMTRGAMSGGGTLGGSASFGINSRGPSQARSEGRDSGYDRLVERESYQLDDTASVTFQMEVDALPSLYDKDEFKSPQYIEADTRFKIDNAHQNDTAPMTNPFEHPRFSELTKQGLVFGRGQNVRYYGENPSSPVIRYPNQTLTGSGTSVDTVDVDLGPVSNYLVRAIKFGLDTNNQIVDVKFVQDELPAVEDAPSDLACRVDHRKLKLNVATDKVDDRMRKALYDPANVDKRLFTPLVDQTPDAINLMMLMSDILACDGLFATLALRAYAQSIGKLKQYRSIYGSGPGGFEQLNDIINPFITSDGNYYYKSDDETYDIDYFKNSSTGLASGVTPSAYIMSMDSPRKYVTMGDFWTQPRGLLMPFKHALANFDACQFYADKAALEVIQKLDTKMQNEGSDVPVVGYSNFGVIVPFSLNDIFEYDATSQTFQSKLSTVTYVANNSVRQRLGSPFWAGIVETFRIEVLPRLIAMNSSWVTNNSVEESFGTGTARYITIPLDFSNDHISFFQMLAADAFARIPRFIPRLIAVYQKFTQDYGFDPIIDDSIIKINKQDAFNGSTFGGVSTGYSLRPVTDYMRLMIEDPERITVEPAPGKSSTLSRSGSALFRGHWAYNMAYDSENQPSETGRARVRFPIHRKGATKSRSYDLLSRIGPKTYFRTRDLPIRMPMPTLGAETSATTAVATDCAMPVAWLSGMPVVLAESDAADAAADASAVITVGDYLSMQRENGRIAPVPAFLLDYAPNSDFHGIRFTQATDGALVSFTQVNDSGWKARYMNHPTESYVVRGVYQDINHSGDDIYIDNVYGVMLHRHLYAITSKADDELFAELMQDFGIALSADGFDGATTQGSYVFDLSLPTCYDAKDGTLDTEQYGTGFACIGSRLFTDMYAMLYFHPFVTSPFFGRHITNYSLGLVSPVNPIPLSLEQVTRTMVIENSYYELERMLGLVGLGTVDWDEYQLRVMSEKEATVDYVLDNKYETADNMLFAGSVSTSAASSASNIENSESPSA